jgi:glutamate carboxypeptidase
MVSLLKEIVQRESPSSDKKAVDQCSLLVGSVFKKLGARVNRIPQKEIGDLYLIEYDPKDGVERDEQILILTHLDTVWPIGKIAKMPFYVSGDRVYGPGVLDMKAGLVMAFYALQALRELNLKPPKKIAVFINSAEETGHEAAHEAIVKLAKRSACVLCLEPALPGGGLKVQRKGRLVIRLDCQGRAAHAGTPEKGLSAIDELLHQLRLVRQKRSKDITINIGQIGGGEKANVVAASSWAVLDIRFWNTAQKEKITAFLKNLSPALQGARVKCAVESFTPPLEKTKASTRLLLQVKAIASELGMELATGKTGGGSDASIASGTGAATIDGLGPDGDGIHAETEHLILPSLVQRTALLTELLLRL